MNFSGNRYDKETLNRIMGSCNHETFVMWCADRFGDYGTVGFAVLGRIEVTLSGRRKDVQCGGRRRAGFTPDLGTARRRAWLVFSRMTSTRGRRPGDARPRIWNSS